MAVILDIDMPESCAECPLNDDEWACIITGKQVESGPRRPAWCPILLGDLFRIEPEAEKDLRVLMEEAKRGKIDLIK
jgi:hypothetical protein